MASRPFLKRLCKQIETLGGEDWVFDQISDGLSIQAIVDQIQMGKGKTPSRPQLYRWRDLPQHRAQRRERWSAARVMSADALLEDGGAILDDLATSDYLTSPEVSLASSRANYRKEMAKLANPAYGDKQVDGGVINIGELHISALRRAGSPMSLPAVDTVAELPEADYEVIE